MEEWGEENHRQKTMWMNAKEQRGDRKKDEENAMQLMRRRFIYIDHFINEFCLFLWGFEVKIKTTNNKKKKINKLIR